MVTPYGFEVDVDEILIDFYRTRNQSLERCCYLIFVLLVTNLELAASSLALVAELARIPRSRVLQLHLRLRGLPHE